MGYVTETQEISRTGRWDRGRESRRLYRVRRWRRVDAVVDPDPDAGADRRQRGRDLRTRGERFGDAFGGAVALTADGSLAIVGADTSDDTNGFKAGSAYLFARSGGDWDQQAKLAASDGNGGAVFGWSVGPSTGGGTGLVGAPGDDENGRQAGLTYVLD
ncbi:hypothetical protein BRC81_09315 [Halobacteriales archaeon QS_1_68_20]|nr:MAG: hypothetical protein BRC81_09315 [Halobacteriales archaeon QS_1_68_20]